MVLLGPLGHELKCPQSASEFQVIEMRALGYDCSTRKRICSLCWMGNYGLTLKGEFTLTESFWCCSTSPVLGSRTSSTASRMRVGNSCYNDESVAQLDPHVTSHHLQLLYSAKTFHSELCLQPPSCPCDRSSRKMKSRRSCRSAEPSLQGKKPSPGPDPLLLLWVVGYSVDTGDTGSTPEDGKED